jgi:acetolactate synthase-1/2/3 large subunit
MNRAESLVRTLIASGVNVCFSNPGTSEMHFVAALDKGEGTRCVLVLLAGWAKVTPDGIAELSVAGVIGVAGR